MYFAGREKKKGVPAKADVAGQSDMNEFLILAFIFFVGSLSGWCLEVVFRKFFSGANPQQRWINPGFLVGPYLPLYGFGLCTLYLLAGLENFSVISDPFWNKVVLFIAMAVAMTVIEYIAGVIFILGMHIKLWDYSDQWGNIKGIICPLFSFFWAVLGAIYYFLIHPYILDALQWLSVNLAFSFVVGFFYGIFLIDVCYSMEVMSKIRRFARENEVVVKYEQLRERLRKEREERVQRARFFITLHTEDGPLYEYLKRLKDLKEESDSFLIHRHSRKK